jgi:hypothetical protein
MNWAGQPLTSHEVAVNLIAGTTTRTGLTVHAERDTGAYPRGIRISDRDMKDLRRRHLTPHQFHGEWNYTIAAADLRQLGPRICLISIMVVRPVGR